jgi:hypothetical protein
MTKFHFVKNSVNYIAMKKYLNINNFKSPEEAVLLLKKTFAFVICCYFISINSIYAQQIIVWPGDANNDGIVNHIDLLHVGAAFGKQGVSRDSISLEWRQFLVDKWADTLPNGLNAGYIDCSGNGMVNIDDVFGIETNYGEINNNFQGLTFQTGTINDPQLSIITNQSIWLPGDTVDVTIFLNQNITDSIYNIAFTFFYDSTIIKEASVNMMPHPQFGGGGTQPVFIQKNYPASGFTEFAISRTNRKNHGGNIAVANASFIIEDNLIGKSFLDVSKAFHLNMIRLHDKVLNNIPAMGDTIDAKISTVVPEMKLKQWISIYPIPAAQNIFIDFKNELTVEQILLMDMNGKVVVTDFNIIGNSAMITLDNVVNGIYVIKVITDRGVMHEKVLVRK